MFIQGGHDGYRHCQSTRRRAMDSFSPRTAAETCSSISRLSNVPALVLSMRVKLSNMSSSLIVVSSLPRTSRSVDRDGSLTISTAHKNGSSTIGKHLRVFVRDNNVDQALRVLKKKLQREGVFREMKRRKAYEKPSERKTREKAEAVRRPRKAARKQAQREGLIPMPKRRDDAPRRAPLPRLF